MINSMTAFARQSYQSEWGELIWEIRSVNHRFLDITIRLPDFLNSLEMVVREAVRKKLNRGKVTLNLVYNVGKKSPYKLELNKDLLKQLGTLSESVISALGPLNTELVNLLRWPGLLSVTEENSAELNEEILLGLNTALDELVQMRAREGQQLALFIKQKLAEINQQVKMIQVQLPSAQATEKQRLKQRFDDLALSLDQSRLEQEMLFYIQKADIAEELSRLEAHSMEVHRILQAGGSVGRRLDFLAQELHREINTLGNKANDAKINQASIEVKVLIEQIREQVQNIE